MEPNIKMLFVALVNKGKPLINDTKSSILDDADILDSRMYRYLK